jgi:drug/metabolite transporter (DMT)-like permease
MTTAAFALVLFSAVLHATWNLLLKLSPRKVAFLWAFSLVSWVTFFIPAVTFLWIEGLSWTAVGFGAGSAVLHGIYGLLLARGYEVGDLSAVYPISRGMGPALVPIFAFLLLDETMSGLAIAGVVLVIIGVYVVQLEGLGLGGMAGQARSLFRPATRIALLTGVFIAAYTIWDAAALDDLPPVAIHEFGLVGYLLLVAPFAFADRGVGVRAEWRENRRNVIAAGLLAPTAYILVLIALETSKVSYVAPVREIGIVLGALMGVVFLGEGYGRFRLAGSLLIVAGVFTLALAP